MNKQKQQSRHRLWWGVLCSLLVGALQGYAQERRTPVRLMVGATGGATLSNVIFLPNVAQNYKRGMELGAVLRADVEKYAGLWLEVDYSVRGWKEEPTEEGGYTYERTLRSVSVPILTHFMIGGGAFKLTIDAGPQFAFLVGESSHSTFPVPKEAPEKSKEMTETPAMTPMNEEVKPLPKGPRQHFLAVQNRFLWGVGGGPGVEYHFRHSVVGLRASYYYGLGDLFKNTRKDYFGKSSEQLLALKAYVMYVF